jgi:hypothetical protein
MQWFKPVILTSEAEIWRLTVQGKPRKKVHEIPISING